MTQSPKIEIMATKIKIFCKLWSRFWFFFRSKGEVKNGLLVDPRDEMAYYPLGSSIVAFPLRGGQKSFLTGHTYLIGTIAISNSGKYLASGETDNVGTKVKHEL